MPQHRSVSFARSPSFLPSSGEDGGLTPTPPSERLIEGSKRAQGFQWAHSLAGLKDRLRDLGLSPRETLEAIADYEIERVEGAAAKVTALFRAGYARHPAGLFWSTIRSRRRGKRAWTPEEVAAWVAEGEPSPGGDADPQIEWLERRYATGKTGKAQEARR